MGEIIRDLTLTEIGDLLKGSNKDLGEAAEFLDEAAETRANLY